MRLTISMIWLLIISYIHGVVAASNINMTYSQFLNSTPTTFGILTVTHARKGQYNYFHQHLQRYATMDCPLMTEISVVWNNDITPEQANITTDPKWKRPVYFRKTPYNSMDFRYLVPNQSTAQVYFMMDDDMLIECEQILKGFKVWQSLAIGDIGPIVGYYARGFNMGSGSSSITYGPPDNGKYQFLTLVGAAWISRFYCDLYNNKNNQLVNQLRQIVQKKNNCDDIGFNFIASYFFPEIIPIKIYGKLRERGTPGSQSRTANHFKFRSECIKQFIDIFGFLPTRLALRSNQNYIKREISEVTKYSTYLRKYYLIDKQISPVSNGSNDTSTSILQGLLYQNTNNIEQQLLQLKDQKNNCKKDATMLQKQLQELSNKYDKVFEQTRKLSQVNKNRKYIKQSQQQSKHEQLSDKNEMSDQIKYTIIFWIAISSSLLNGLVLIILCYKFVRSYCKQSKQISNLQEKQDVKDLQVTNGQIKITQI